VVNTVNLSQGSQAMTIPAKYEQGVFKPLLDVRMPEGTLVEVHLPAPSAQRPKSVRDLGICGRWADRDDIADGVSYVNRLRDQGRMD
jgi:hypothetical protein